MRGNSILQTRGLCIGYAPKRRERVEVATGIGVELCQGEMVCLLGPNGAGKSTLMRTLAGLQKPLAGEVLLQGSGLHHLAADERARLGLLEALQTMPDAIADYKNLTPARPRLIELLG